MRFSFLALLGCLFWLSFHMFCSSTVLQRNGGEFPLIQTTSLDRYSWKVHPSLNATASNFTSSQVSTRDGASSPGSTLRVTIVSQSTNWLRTGSAQPTGHAPPPSSNGSTGTRYPAATSNATFSPGLKGSVRGTAFSGSASTREPISPTSKPVVTAWNSSLSSGVTQGRTQPTGASSSAARDTALDPFTITPTYPLICSSASITYSSTRPVKTGQLLIEPAQHVEWQMSPNWTFSVTGGGKIKRMFSNDGPDTSFSGPIIHNGDPKANPDGSWTLTTKDGSVTRAIFAVFEGQSTSSDGSFPFTITAPIKCDKPVPKTCNTQDHQLSQDQWVAFSTDTFLNQSIANWTKQSNKQSDFWPWFVKEYVGDGFATSCTVDQDGGCGLLTQSCVDMKDTPWLRQAYLVLASMMQVSRFLHFAYSAFGQAEKDLQSYIPSWDLAFSVPDKQSSWKTILAVFASVTGMLSVVAFFVAPFLAGAAAFTASITGAVIFGISAAFNGAINFANAAGQEIAEPMFTTYAQSLSSMKDFIEINQWDLIDLHNSYFLNGTNLTSLLLGGVFVGGQLISQVVDTNNIPETADASLSGKIKGAANWYDKFTILNLLNAAWTSTGIYIVYIPYGDDIKYFGKGASKFGEADCMGDHFYEHGRYNDTVAFCCNCAPDRPGMLAFMNSGFRYGEYQSLKGRNFFDVQGYKIIDYAFNYKDVLTSAFKSYDGHGYKYNVTHETTRQALDTGNYDLLKSWTSLKPTDAGVFNIPVCEVHDLAEVPGCYAVGGDEWVRCWAQPGSCLTDSAKYTAPSTGKVSYFRDNVVEEVITSLGYNQPIGDFLLGARELEPGEEGEPGEVELELEDVDEPGEVEYVELEPRSA